MSGFEDSYQEIPLRIVVGNFLMAILFDFMSFPFGVFFWLPELTALALLYWVMYLPNRIDMGTVSLIGLLVDVGTATSLGLHALSYAVMVFFTLRHHCQIMLYGYTMQIFVILALLLCDQTVLVVACLLLDRRVTTLQSFIASTVRTLLWPLSDQLIRTVTNFHRICR